MRGALRYVALLTLGFCGCKHESPPRTVGTPKTSTRLQESSSIAYPASRREPAFTVQDGLPVGNPYAWLEASNAEVSDWVEAQNALADGVAPSDRAEFAKSLRESVGVVWQQPVARTGVGKTRFFYQRANENGAVLAWRDGADGPEHTMTRSTILEWTPSPTGALLAVISRESDDGPPVLSVRKVESDELVETITGVDAVPPAWSDDRNLFYAVRSSGKSGVAVNRRDIKQKKDVVYFAGDPDPQSTVRMVIENGWFVLQIEHERGAAADLRVATVTPGSAARWSSLPASAWARDDATDGDNDVARVTVTSAGVLVGLVGRRTTRLVTFALHRTDATPIALVPPELPNVTITDVAATGDGVALATAENLVQRVRTWSPSEKGAAGAVAETACVAHAGVVLLVRGNAEPARDKTTNPRASAYVLSANVTGLKSCASVIPPDTAPELMVAADPVPLRIVRWKPPPAVKTPEQPSPDAGSKPPEPKAPEPPTIAVRYDDRSAMTWSFFAAMRAWVRNGGAYVFLRADQKDCAPATAREGRLFAESMKTDSPGRGLCDAGMFSFDGNGRSVDEECISQLMRLGPSKRAHLSDEVFLDASDPDVAATARKLAATMQFEGAGTVYYREGDALDARASAYAFVLARWRAQSSGNVGAR